MEWSYTYDGATWCAEHPCPSGPIEPAQRGTCKVGRIHKAEAVYWVPVMGVHVCKKHLGAMIREVIRRSEYGR